MTRPAARLGDTFTDTDVIAEGSGNVFVNGIPKARLGDLTTGHTLPGHGFYPPVPIIEGSGSVFVNGIPAARLGDKHAIHCDPPHPASDCHDGVINTGSGDVFIG
jgi:uncharacterized Zn-binding protein involved in type VI secretion